MTTVTKPKTAADYARYKPAELHKLAAQQANTIMQLNRDLNAVKAAVAVSENQHADCRYPDCSCVQFCSITLGRKP